MPLQGKSAGLALMRISLLLLSLFQLASAAAAPVICGAGFCDQLAGASGAGAPSPASDAEMDAFARPGTLPSFAIQSSRPPLGRAARPDVPDGDWPQPAVGSLHSPFLPHHRAQFSASSPSVVPYDSGRVLRRAGLGAAGAARARPHTRRDREPGTRGSHAPSHGHPPPGSKSILIWPKGARGPIVSSDPVAAQPFEPVQAYGPRATPPARASSPEGHRTRRSLPRGEETMRTHDFFLLGPDGLIRRIFPNAGRRGKELTPGEGAEAQQPASVAPVQQVKDTIADHGATYGQQPQQHYQPPPMPPTVPGYPGSGSAPPNTLLGPPLVPPMPQPMVPGAVPRAARFVGVPAEPPPSLPPGALPPGSLQPKLMASPSPPADRPGPGKLVKVLVPAKPSAPPSVLPPGSATRSPSKPTSQPAQPAKQGSQAGQPVKPTGQPSKQTGQPSKQSGQPNRQPGQPSKQINQLESPSKPIRPSGQQQQQQQQPPPPPPPPPPSSPPLDPTSGSPPGRQFAPADPPAHGPRAGNGEATWQDPADFGGSGLDCSHTATLARRRTLDQDCGARAQAPVIPPRSVAGGGGVGPSADELLRTAAQQALRRAALQCSRPCFEAFRDETRCIVPSKYPRLCGEALAGYVRHCIRTAPASYAALLPSDDAELKCDRIGGSYMRGGGDWRGRRSDAMHRGPSRPNAASHLPRASPPAGAVYASLLAVLLALIALG
ncbi:hypothetical protein H696_03347 [Fonticula alba]|uniref:FZ domain-containing protein n=1 Tax=Fonticula alba TaxID=691883 RepID=A0A058Z6I4_FONAL|nr:hypothetical protein H696_03347 [Fonticula alba]KCV69875.1 hypothetical protein H696_03347 [Fonticula alba]|eukprot:XP_009495481.1 hypothetical protein H696_03347 [Fonticula alba]